MELTDREKQADLLRRAYHGLWLQAWRDEEESVKAKWFSVRDAAEAIFTALSDVSAVETARLRENYARLIALKGGL